MVVVVHNNASRLALSIADLGALLTSLVSEYEVIIVDNASTDESVSVLKRLTEVDGLPNLQVFALTKEVDWDTAAWAGLDNALGDFAVAMDPEVDDFHVLPTMMERAASGSDVVFAINKQRPTRGLLGRVPSATFGMLYKWCSGIDPVTEAPPYRLLSRRVLNFVLQHPMPAIAYHSLSATRGFPRATITYSTPPRGTRRNRLGETIDAQVRHLVSGTRTPMRLVTSLSLFGAISNVLYSGYVLAIALWKTDVEPGWVTLSLQQSGMFVLISLVLFVLGEYILQMASLSNEGPPYHVAQEFKSAVLTRREKLNVEDGMPNEELGCPAANSHPICTTQS